MDLISIPACALYRSVGTVIVRVNMEVICCCRGRPSGRKPVHLIPGCELCKRTRLISKYNSDCDSVVDRCRPYRSSSARSRYVNFCAAVCLLLLVGGLSPQSSASPHRSRVMERLRRANGENRLWANPCDYNDSNSKSASSTSKHSTDIAPKLAAQARNANASAAKYKDIFALKLHSFSSFDALLSVWDDYEWLRKFKWYRPEVLPMEKKLPTKMSEEYLNELMGKINEVLPVMYKGLKMIVAGLYAFSTEGLNDNIISDETLKENIHLTMHDVRAVLCYFSDIMKARNLEVLPLLDSEIPDFNSEDRLSVGLLLYRDTLNYLDYLAQVFEHLHKTGSA